MLGMLVPSLIVTMVLGFSAPFAATVARQRSVAPNANPGVA